MPRGVAIGPRRVPTMRHGGPIAGHPLTHRLVNAAWGTPLRDVFGNLTQNTPTIRPAFGGPMLGNQGNASRNTGHHYWRAMNLVTSSSPLSLFALIWLASTSERGVVVGIGDVLNGDTGMTIGVGATAPDAVGNNITGVRGGINYTQSGAAIGTGLHSIGYTTDGSSVQWFVDGVRQSTGGTGASYNVSTPPSRFLMLAHGGSSSLGPSAGVYVIFGGAWARVLPANAFAMLHDDPWCFVRG